MASALPWSWSWSSRENVGGLYSGHGYRVTRLLDSQGTEQSTVPLQAGFVLECEVYLSQATQASIHSRGGRANAPLNWETGSAWCFLLFHKDKKSTFVRNRPPDVFPFPWSFLLIQYSGGGL